MFVSATTGMPVASTPSPSSVETSATTQTSSPTREKQRVFTAPSYFNTSLNDVAVTVADVRSTGVTIGVSTGVSWPHFALPLLPSLLMITLCW